MGPILVSAFCGCMALRCVTCGCALICNDFVTQLGGQRDTKNEKSNGKKGIRTVWRAIEKMLNRKAYAAGQEGPCNAHNITYLYLWVDLLHFYCSYFRADGTLLVGIRGDAYVS